MFFQLFSDAMTKVQILVMYRYQEIILSFFVTHIALWSLCIQ